MSPIQLLKFIVRHPMNRQRPLAAVSRFLKWQISSRLAPGPIVFEWINGVRCLVRKGETGMTGNVYTGLHEFTDMAFVLHFLRADDLFVDVGANVGSYTLLACGAAGAEGIVIEPVPATFRRLEDNIALNRLQSKVKLFNVALGSADGELRFSSLRDTMNHVIAEAEQEADSICVPVRRLDDLTDGREPVLMKIDVEGYELSVLQGAGRLLKSECLHAVIMELNGTGHRYGYSDDALLAVMYSNGFAPHAYDPMRRQLSKLDGKSVSGGNTLFVRDSAQVVERLRSADRIKFRDQSI